MTNNLEIIKPLLLFESEDDFYFLQILQRKKENDELGSNSRVIKNYSITSITHLEKHYPEIISLCQKFNARAMLRLNKRSFEKTAFHTLINISNNMMNRDFVNVNRCYDRACGQNHNDKNKKWILDVDSKDLDVKRLITAVQFCDPEQGTEKHYCVIPSKNGYHLLTKPFNIEQFKNMRLPEIDIQKDNPVNLYFP